MTILQAFILGIVQGITEFLPISSSGHLVIVPFIFGWQIPSEQIFPFDVLVQMGTLLAVIIYFWKDLIKLIAAFVKSLLNKQPFATQDARFGWYLILATIPAVVGGLFLKDAVKSFFHSISATAIFLFVTAVLLAGSELIGKQQKEINKLNWLKCIDNWIFPVVINFSRCFKVRFNDCRRRVSEFQKRRCCQIFISDVHPGYARCRIIKSVGFI